MRFEINNQLGIFEIGRPTLCASLPISSRQIRKLEFRCDDRCKCKTPRSALCQTANRLRRTRNSQLIYLFIRVKYTFALPSPCIGNINKRKTPPIIEYVRRQPLTVNSGGSSEQRAAPTAIGGICREFTVIFSCAQAHSYAA